MKNIETVLEKVATKLEEANEVVDAERMYTKIAFAKRAIELSNNDQYEKTAAPAEAAAGIGGTLARALVAGIGLGLAGEVIGAGHKKIKEKLFDSKLDSYANVVKKQSPELQNANKEEVKKLLRAGYTLAPDIIQNPTLAASFVSIGKSLGGKIDPNTMKLMAETGNKAREKTMFQEAFPNGGSLM